MRGVDLMNIVSSYEDDRFIINIDGLKKGMGQTYGNFIRRLVMLELGGYEVIAVRINGGEALTLFNIVENVSQDVLEICYNLQELKFERKEGQNKEEVLRVIYNSTSDVITGGMIVSKDLEVLNKNQLICNLVGDTGLSLELFIAYNTGIVSSEDNKLMIESLVGSEEGLIYMDTFHKSFDRVYFNVEDNGNVESLKIVVSGVSSVGVENINAILTDASNNILMFRR